MLTLFIRKKWNNGITHPALISMPTWSCQPGLLGRCLGCLEGWQAEQRTLGSWWKHWGVSTRPKSAFPRASRSLWSSSPWGIFSPVLSHAYLGATIHYALQEGAGVGGQQGWEIPVVVLHTSSLTHSVLDTLGCDVQVSLAGQGSLRPQAGGRKGKGQGSAWGSQLGFLSSAAWAPSLALPLSCPVALGKSFNLSELQLSHPARGPWGPQGQHTYTTQHRACQEGSPPHYVWLLLNSRKQFLVTYCLNLQFHFSFHLSKFLS